MKSFVKPGLVAAAMLAMAQPVLAGGMAAPIVEPETISKEAAATSAPGYLVPLLLLALVALAVSSNNGSGTPGTK